MNYEKWKEIVTLFDRYVELISVDQYKSNDGKLSLEYHYNSFRETGHWILNHPGYVNNFWEDGETAEEVINKGIVTLKVLIKEEMDGKLKERMTNDFLC